MTSSPEAPDNTTTREPDNQSIFHLDIIVVAKRRLSRNARAIGATLQRVISEDAEFGPLILGLIDAKTSRLSRPYHLIHLKFAVILDDSEHDQLVDKLNSITSGLHAVYGRIVSGEVLSHKRTFLL